MVETMTAEEVADAFKVTMPTVYRWAREGILPAHKLGRTLRFNKEDVEAHLSQPSSAAQPTDPIVDALAEAVIARLRDMGYLDSKEGV